MDALLKLSFEELTKRDRFRATDVEECVMMHYGMNDIDYKGMRACINLIHGNKKHKWNQRTHYYERIEP